MKRLWLVLALSLLVGAVVSGQRIVIRNSLDVDSSGVVTNGMTLPDTSGGMLAVIIAPRESTMRSRYDASPSSYPMLSSNPSNCSTSPGGTGCEQRSTHQAMQYRMQAAPRTCGGTASGIIDTCQDAKNWVLQCMALACWSTNADTDRWSARFFLLSTIWLWDEFSGTQKSDLVAFANRRIGYGTVLEFGGGRLGADDDPDNLGSNYNWARYANLTIWGVATRQLTGYTMPGTDCSWGTVMLSINWCGDDQRAIAEEMLVEAKYRIDTMQTFMNTHRGGVFFDGRMYGQYLYDYSVIPFQIALDYGKDYPADTNWWADSIWFSLNETTPKATYHVSDSGMMTYQCTSFGATNLTSGRCEVDTLGMGNFFTFAANYWDGEGVEAYLRYYLTNRSSAVEAWTKLLDADLGAAGTNYETAGFPLAFYAPGSGRLISRNTWTDASSPVVFSMNLGNSRGHHQTKDAGGWQVLACGTGADDCFWVSKEASCYGLQNYYLPNAAGTDTDCVSNVGQNTLLSGSAFVYSGTTDLPTVTRLDRTSNYVVGCTNLDAENWSTTLPFSAWIRCFVHVPARNYMVKFDRVAVANTSVPMIDTVRCPVAFTNPATGHYRCTMGSAQVLDTWSLSRNLNSQSSIFGTRDEAGSALCAAHPDPNGNCDPQYRLEDSVTGCTSCYLATVHHARASGGTAMSTPTIGYSGGVITVTLELGGVTDVITFTDGTTDTGGTINLNGGGAVAFDSGVDTVTSTPTTFAWN